jgi:hypothetical protein
MTAPVLTLFDTMCLFVSGYALYSAANSTISTWQYLKRPQRLFSLFLLMVISAWIIYLSAQVMGGTIP